MLVMQTFAIKSLNLDLLASKKLENTLAVLVAVIAQ